MTSIPSLLLVGCGKMGGALLERWKQSAIAAQFDIIDPTHAQKNESNVHWHTSLDAIPATCSPSVVVLAVKPQQLAQLLPAYKIRFAKNPPLYISVAAGKTLSFYAAQLGEHAHVVRAMPNTPALVAQGMSVLCAASTLPASSRKIATDLLKSVGKCEWIDDEAKMDAVTAISGCGPAYVFLFIDSLVKAGVAMGLAEPLAKTLALQTISGSIELAAQSTRSLEQLRIDVASPGGATQAALDVLMKNGGLISLIRDAAEAAENRSQELSSDE